MHVKQSDNNPSSEGTGRYRVALGGTITLFVILGLSLPIYSNLAPRFSGIFALRPVHAALLQSMLGLAYFLLAVPAALIIRRLGYKIGLILGLCGFASGAFLISPAVVHHQYVVFLAGVVIMGGGYAWIEASANPLVALMGERRNAVLRLNFAQAFYPVGLLIGAYASDGLMAASFQNPNPSLTQVVERPYLLIGLALILLAFLIENMNFPRLAATSGRGRFRLWQEFGSLLGTRQFRFGIVAQAAGIAAQTCVWALIAQYLRDRLPGTTFSPPEVLIWCWIAYAGGRFTGTALMMRFSAETLLSLFAVCGVGCAAMASVLSGISGLACLVAISFFISIAFPTIFGLSIRRIEASTKTASGLLVAGSGFGVTTATLVMNLGLSNPSLLLGAIVVPGLGLVFLYGRREQKLNAMDKSAAAQLGRMQDRRLI